MRSPGVGICVHPSLFICQTLRELASNSTKRGANATRAAVGGQTDSKARAGKAGASAGAGASVNASKAKVAVQPAMPFMTGPFLNSR